MKTTIDNAKVFPLIDEYAGKHFRFLSNHLDGDYEPYVDANLDKITRVQVGTKSYLRSEYRGINPVFLKMRVLNECERTLRYVRRNFLKE